MKEAKKTREYHEALLEERDTLLELARDGWPVRCIITPHERRLHRVPQSVEKRDLRFKHLIEFLESEDEKAIQARENIEWVISPFRQWNIYIIGRISCFEGFRRTFGSGYDLTLRESGREAIEGKTRVFDELFKHVKTYTLTTFSKGPECDCRLALRQAAIQALRNPPEDSGKRGDGDKQIEENEASHRGGEPQP